MSIAGVGGVSSMVNNSPQAVENVQSKSAELGKHDFLKLLVTQLTNQDPLKPMENTEFVAQMTTFANLENSNEQIKLLESMNEKLNLMVNQGGSCVCGSNGKVSEKNAVPAV